MGIIGRVIYIIYEKISLTSGGRKIPSLKKGGMRVGEPSVQIIESNVQHNTEDIRELKKRVERAESDISDVKTNQQVTNQNISHVMDTLTDLKAGFKELDNKMDTSNMEQLKEYKNAVWKVGVTIIATVLGGFLLFAFGL